MTDQHRGLILSIYDTVADYSRWPQVLDRVAEAVGARGCIVFEMEGTGPDRTISAPFCSSSNEQGLLEKYLAACVAEEMADQDVFEAHSAAADGIDLVNDTILAPSEHELARRRNVRLLRRFGIGHRAAGLLSKDNRSRGRFSVQLDAGRGRLTPAERHVAAMLMPHLAKAIELGRAAYRLAEEREALLAAMDRLRIGIAVLDSDGRVAVANEEFERQGAEYELFGRDRSDRFRMSGRRAQSQLSGLLDDVLHHGQFGGRPRKEAILAGREGEPSVLCVEAVRLGRVPALSDQAWNGALLFSLDTSMAADPDAELVRSAFGLTDAETELTVLVGKGLTNREIAELRGRSIETINAQVKSLLSKTQCANRTQLVRLLTSFSSHFLKDSAGPQGF